MFMFILSILFVPSQYAQAHADASDCLTQMELNLNCICIKITYLYETIKECLM